MMFCLSTSRAFARLQELFTSLSNGEIRKLSMVDLLNPFSAAWKNARRARKVVTDHNLKVSACSGTVESLLGSYSFGRDSKVIPA